MPVWQWLEYIDEGTAMDKTIGQFTFDNSKAVKKLSNYTVRCSHTEEDGSIVQLTHFYAFNDIDDHRDEITKELTEFYKDDKNFSIIYILQSPNNKIDYLLMDRMNSVRSICELGHRVRADAKIRNRQPLSFAYVMFSDKNVRDYMIYIDGKDNEYTNILCQELNVDEVIFVQDTKQFVDVILKPNFKVLGPKGFGKQAQKLKGALSNLSAKEREDIYYKLEVKEIVNICDVPLSFEDIEVEFTSKAGFASANSKVGVIIIDTNLTKNLIERGIVADLRSSLQNVRRSLNLGITQKVDAKIFCDNNEKEIISKWDYFLKRECLFNNFELLPFDQKDDLSHKIIVDNKEVFVEIS